MSSDREIFSHVVEGKARYFDPLIVEDRWADAMEPLDAEAFQDQLKSPVRRASTAAHHKFLDAIREAFQLRPLDPETGEGSTAQECFDLSAAFWSWRESLKTPGDVEPGSSPPTDQNRANSPVSSDGTAST